MSSVFWWSALLGAGLSALSGLTSYYQYRWALRLPDRAFFKVVLGGLLLRLTAMLALVAAVLVAAPVDVLGFVSGLLFVFMLSLIFEMTWIHRRAATE